MEKLVVCMMVLGCVALAAADCGPLQALKVKAQWEQVYGMGQQRVDVGHALWKSLFASVPASRDLFGRVHGDNIFSEEFTAHSSRVLGGLDMCISLLDDPATLNAQLVHLNGQHKERKIDASYFDALGNAIVDVFPGLIGHCFDQEAWQACYAVIADGIKK